MGGDTAVALTILHTNTVYIYIYQMEHRFTSMIFNYL
nr:MAG TPA: hypothetical protein [Bacteriophage sp.]